MHLTLSLQGVTEPDNSPIMTNYANYAKYAKNAINAKNAKYAESNDLAGIPEPDDPRYLQVLLSLYPRPFRLLLW